EIVAVIETLRGRCALVVEGHDSRGDKLAVKAESENISARGRQHQPGAVDMLTPVKRDRAQAEGRRNSDSGPHQMSENGFQFGRTSGWRRGRPGHFRMSLTRAVW